MSNSPQNVLKKHINTDSDTTKASHVTWKRTLSQMSEYNEENPDEEKRKQSFESKAREFDRKHDLQPEEVAVHHLAMPHENEGHHFLRGHKEQHYHSPDNSHGSGKDDSDEGASRRTHRKTASFSSDDASGLPVTDSRDHTEFERKAREFDRKHDLQPEEVAVHH
eukprot:CAMPEP_0114427228 /NCGR_PEP_ID=MMETSP0103-20121206/8227_1 /TAXON_ID=37642 ORGANISM="Paraphysomonas imperforata, Strain PA2" /NCGR_SAMPLE_ID=MMETSP0103 /ASSEMBLY_ACC=CAM_ASM_000201 /LENGTH=164 /DNA_ID=CAMNT_0001596257 /DNA_START=8 /DNA_END=499 /DNA_ORIENTATION=+